MRIVITQDVDNHHQLERMGYERLETLAKECGMSLPTLGFFGMDKAIIIGNNHPHIKLLITQLGYLFMDSEPRGSGRTRLTVELLWQIVEIYKQLHPRDPQDGFLHTDLTHNLPSPWHLATHLAPGIDHWISLDSQGVVTGDEVIDRRYARTFVLK